MAVCATLSSDRSAVLRGSASVSSMEGAVTDDFHPRDAWLTDLRKHDALDVFLVFVSGAYRQLKICTVVLDSVCVD